MALIWIGALLVVAGVVFAAAQALWAGRLSDARSSRPGQAGDTLEPQARSSGFGLRANWPALTLIAVGSALLLAGAAI